uniref:Uncharacterized protein n=1 Tax=Tanacetum cinerariifolium TaxID=118510 RepID=A0A6L2K7T1_TANCI|nr:hypothetical protein [Tanacetum cinerariifolium]
MFGSEFITIVEPCAKLVNGMNLPLQLEKRVYPPSGSQMVDLVLDHMKYKVIPSDIVKTYKLCGYASAIVTNKEAQYEFELRWGKVSNSLEIYSSPILRKIKEMTGFMDDQWARFYLTEGINLKDGVIHLDVC